MRAVADTAAVQTLLSLGDSLLSFKALLKQITALNNQREPLAMELMRVFGLHFHDRRDPQKAANFQVCMTEYAVRNLLVTERADLDRRYGIYGDPDAQDHPIISVPVGVKLDG